MTGTPGTQAERLLDSHHSTLPGEDTGMLAEGSAQLSLGPNLRKLFR